MFALASVVLSVDSNRYGNSVREVRLIVMQIGKRWDLMLPSGIVICEWTLDAKIDSTQRHPGTT